MQYGLDESGMEDERDGVSRVFSAQIREQCNIEEGKLYCTGTGWHWEHYRVQTVLQCDVEHTGWYEEQNKVKCGTEQGGTSHGMEGNGCCEASLGQWRVTWKRPLKFFNESALAAHKCCISMTAF